MSEQEKEAIEYIKAFQKDLYGASEKNLMAIYIDRVWNYIDKLQKVIDLMAELLCGIDVMNELGKDSWNWNKEQMKEHFYKKVEEEND